MSIKEIEEAFEVLPFEEKKELLDHLLELWEDALDIQASLKAQQEGGYIDYREWRKRYPHLQSDETSSQ